MPPAAKVNKKGGKGGKRKTQDSFARKDWYDIKAPRMFGTSNAGKTIVNRTTGNKIASDSLKGRVVTLNLADLQQNEKYAHTNVKLRVEEVQGKHCLTNFYGLSYTTDKVKSLVKKWQSLIEVSADVKTNDGYLVRVFCIAFTQPRPGQKSNVTYAQTAQIRQIRAKMTAIITKEVISSEYKDLVSKFIVNVIGESIQRQCQGIFPLRDVAVRKVKLLKAPKLDPKKLLEIHNEAAPAAGKKVKK